MSDAAHVFGSDLQVDATGDLLLVDGSALTQQRILRRLLTNGGDYIWQLNYGAGLGLLIGQNIDAAATQNLVRTQIFEESAVAQSPPPTVSVSGDASGTEICTIAYTDAVTGATQTLTVPGA